MSTLTQAIPEAFTSEAFESLEAAQERFNQDLHDLFPEVPPQPIVEPTSSLDSKGEVTFGWAIAGDGEGNVDMEALKELQGVVRWAIEALKNDEERCGKVRVLRLLEYGWFQEQEMQGMAEIVSKSKNLEIFQIAQNDDTYNASYSAYIEPLWESLKRAPLLSTIVTQNGPVVPYQYDTFGPSLTRLDLSSAEIDETDGTLPKGLKQLTIDYIGGFNKTWFTPDVFSSLEMLLLRNMQVPTLEVMTSAVRDFTGTDRQGTLTHLSLDLFRDYHEAFFPANQARPTFDAFLGSFAPFYFPKLATLEILSTVSTTPTSPSELDPNPVLRLNKQTIEDGIALVGLISRNWRLFLGLESLVLFFGPGDGFVTVDDYTEVVGRITLLLAPIETLKTLSINLIHSRGPLDPSASTDYFLGIPSLRHLSLRAKHTSPEEAKGFKLLSKTTELRVEEEGFMALLGEEAPEGVAISDIGNVGEEEQSQNPTESADAVVDRLLGRLSDEL